MDVLNEWAQFLHKPLMDDRVGPITLTDDPQFGREVARKVHTALRRTGGVTPPREFVLMDRSAIGLGGVFPRLRAQLNRAKLYRIADEVEWREAERTAAERAVTKEGPRHANKGGC